MTRPDSIQVGIITSAHGIRGQVKIRSFTDNPKDIATLGALTDAKGKSFAIKLHGGTDKALIASVEGITDRNTAELLRGTALYAPAGKFKDTRHAMIGLSARTADGKNYGTIIATHNFGAGDIVEIEKSDGTTEMLPLQEHFIRLSDDKTHAVIQLFEFVESSDNKEE